MNNKIFSTFNNNFSQIIIIDYLFTQTFTFKKIVQEKKKKNSWTIPTSILKILSLS